MQEMTTPAPAEPRKLPVPISNLSGTKSVDLVNDQTWSVGASHSTRRAVIARCGQFCFGEADSEVPDDLDEENPDDDPPPDEPELPEELELPE